LRQILGGQDLTSDELDSLNWYIVLASSKFYVSSIETKTTIGITKY